MVDPTWLHLFISLCMAKHAKNGISAKHLNQGNFAHETIFIWNQNNLGKVLTHVYDYTFSVIMAGPIRPKMVLWTDKPLEPQT